MNSVIIIANSRYPEGTANSINVFRMAAAFASEGFNVRLIALRSSFFISKVRLWHETCRRYGDLPAVSGNFVWWPPTRAAEPVLAVLAFFVLLFSDRRTLVYSRICYVAAIAAAMGFHTVFESHAPPKNKVRKKIESGLLRRDNALVVLISEGLRRKYEEKGLDTEPTLIAPDAGRLLKTSAPQRDEFQGPCRNVGYIGSLYSGRGFEVIVSVAVKMPEHLFHIVGDINQLSSNSDHLPENVILRGAVTPDEAERMTASFDAFLMPYQREVRIGNNMDTVAWMSPMKMFEYMLSGRPIIASDLPVLREILKQSETAVLVEPANIDAWVEALHRLDSPELRYRLAGKAYEDASANYTWDIRLRRIMKCIKH